MLRSHDKPTDSKLRSGKDFRWAVGFEGSFIPHLQIDEYEWTQHDRFWKDDFRRVAEELGCRCIRYALPWHALEPQRGAFDWRWSDERFEFAHSLGLELIVDLVHFGVPAWLPDSFGDVDFPPALESFSAAFGSQYRGRIASVCPINEPLITALFCGDVGLWPPHGRTLHSYMTIVSRITQALARSIIALRQTMPGVEILICDALEFASICQDENYLKNPVVAERLRADVARRNVRRHLIGDLLLGRVDCNHELYQWLAEHHFPIWDLNWFSRHPVRPDLLGLDYYPHTEVELYTVGDGEIRQRVPSQLRGLEAIARDYWDRYHIPLMVAETSFTGNDKDRQAWLETTVSDVRKLRASGIPVTGYTWWPAVDHLDWDGALLHRVGHIHPVGLYRLRRAPGNVLERARTPLVDSYRKLCRGGDAAAGPLAEPTIQATEPVPASPCIMEKPSFTRPKGHPIIVHCHLRWDGVWQRPQQFLSRLSREHRVLFVEGPILRENDDPPTWTLKEASDFPNVTIMQTFFPASRFSDGQWVDEQRYKLLGEALAGPLKGQFDRPVQWFYDPMAVPCFAGRLDESAIVYDCMDELSQFKFAPPEIVTRERQLLAQADLVFTGGRKMWESKKRFNSNCHFYGCGVDVPHFSKARSPETPFPSDISFVYKPILGYFGVVDERLDYDLLTKLADANPDWSIVMIGPVAKVDPNHLPRRPRLYWLGRREYNELPAYTKAFDVCLMPFALNAATEYINPTKALEYMAAGRPIVSSAVPDVVSNFGQVVKIGHSHEEFIAHCREAVENADQPAIERGLQMAAENQWEAIVAKLEQHLEEALKKKRKRAPRSEAALAAA